MTELWDDAVVVWEQSPRQWLQCADVIVSLQASTPVALSWAHAVLASFPGCTMAVACLPDGGWVVSLRRVVAS